MIKIYAIIGGVILALSAGLYFSLSGLFTARAELRSTHASLDKANATNKALEAFTESLQAQVMKASQDAGKARRGIEHVLSEQPDWSSAPVPADVTTELCKQLTCAPAKTR